MAKESPKLVQCGNCKKCEPVTEPTKCSVKGEPIIGKCPHWTESASCLLSWPHVCKFYKDKGIGVSVEL